MSFKALGTYPEKGQKVKIRNLGPTTGWMIAERYLKARCADSTGTVRNIIPGHGGDVWWVEHEDESFAPYGIDEIEPLNG